MVALLVEIRLRHLPPPIPTLSVLSTEFTERGGPGGLRLEAVGALSESDESGRLAIARIQARLSGGPGMLSIAENVALEGALSAPKESGLALADGQSIDELSESPRTVQPPRGEPHG